MKKEMKEIICANCSDFLGFTPKHLRWIVDSEEIVKTNPLTLTNSPPLYCRSCADLIERGII